MPIHAHIAIREVEAGQVLAEPIFQLRYGMAAPDFPHHVIAFATTLSGDSEPVAYLHFTDMGEFMLGGGACVDNRVIKKLSADTRASIHAAGGLYRMVLEWSLLHFRSRSKAIFGYCGDALAERTDLAAGFRKTRHEHLLVYFTRELPEQEMQRLIGLAHSIGPF